MKNFKYLVNNDCVMVLPNYCAQDQYKYSFWKLAVWNPAISMWQSNFISAQLPHLSLLWKQVLVEQNFNSYNFRVSSPFFHIKGSSPFSSKQLISGSNPLPCHKVDLTPRCFHVKYLICRYLLSDIAEWK